MGNNGSVARIINILPRPEGLDDLTDGELVDLCVGGRENAFVVLVRRYQRMVFAMCYRSTNNRDDAEDLCQEVFIRVHGALPSFRRGAPIRPWLHRITYNRIMSFLKKRASLREVADVSADRRSPAPGPDRYAQVALAVERLAAEFVDLPEHYRNVLIMRNFMGMSYDDMAYALGISVGNVKTHLFRARRSLQKRQRDLLLQLSSE